MGESGVAPAMNAGITGAGRSSGRVSRWLTTIWTDSIALVTGWTTAEHVGACKCWILDALRVRMTATVVQRATADVNAGYTIAAISGWTRAAHPRTLVIIQSVTRDSYDDRFSRNETVGIVAPSRCLMGTVREREDRVRIYESYSFRNNRKREKNAKIAPVRMRPNLLRDLPSS